VLDQGTLEKVAPKLPFDVGHELELKLGEVGLHDAHAGVGKVGDVDVVVGGAAKLVGKKVKARIAAVSAGLAWAELLSPLEQAQEPLTAESEAEKPTRSRRAPAKKAPEVAEVAEEAEVAEVAEEPVAEEPVEGDDAQAAPKKRTRRGTRGGRNRKKKTATTAGTVVLRPIIHIPERGLGETEPASEDGEAAAAPKKKTRRGSRGGKNRRKKTVTATASPNGSDPGAVEEAVEEVPADEWSYTPMSEWDLEDE